jgi:hypothetical protein
VPSTGRLACRIAQFGVCPTFGGFGNAIDVTPSWRNSAVIISANVLNDYCLDTS